MKKIVILRPSKPTITVRHLVETLKQGKARTEGKEPMMAKHFYLTMVSRVTCGELSMAEQMTIMTTLFRDTPQ